MNGKPFITSISISKMQAAVVTKMGQVFVTGENAHG
jgi:hypothetical protein